MSLEVLSSNYLLPTLFKTPSPFSYVMEKSLSAVPILTGKENYREWALAIHGLALWNNFSSHLEDADYVSRIMAIEEPKEDAAKAANAALMLETQKLGRKAQGVIRLTVTTIIALDLNALAIVKREGQEADKPTAFDMWQHLRTKYKTRDGVTSLLDFTLGARGHLPSGYIVSSL